MKKGSGTKTRISVTLDSSLVENINKHCDKNLIKVSAYIESILRKSMK